MTKLVEVARHADPDPWRNRFREALLRLDRATLERLAEEVPLREVPPGTAYLLGVALKDLGALDKAGAVLREAQRHHPNNFWLNEELGWFSRDVCRPPRYADAVRYYHATVVLRPRSWRTHWNLAESLDQQGAHEDALAELSKASEVEPDNAVAWHFRGNFYRRRHEYDKAVADYSRAIELNPDYAEAWYDRSYAYRLLHEYDKALADANRAIELMPVPWYVYYKRRGLAHFRLKHYEQALADIAKAVELRPDDMSNLWWIPLEDVASCPDEKFRTGWRALFDKTIEFFKSKPDAAGTAKWHNNLAWWLANYPSLKLGDPGQAVAHAQKAVELEPGNGTYWNTLGVAQYRHGAWKAAIKALMKSVQLLKGQHESFNFFFLAMAHWQLGEKDKARAWYDQAVAWMDQHAPQDEELKRFRVEAASLLGLAKAAPTQKKKD